MESLKTGDIMTMQAALSLRRSLAGFFLPESTTIQEAQASLEWTHWKGMTEFKINGLVANGVWDQVKRPADKLVVGTKILFKRKIGENGEVEKYKCRIVARGFQQVKGLHFQETSLPTPAAASIRMIRATGAVEDLELRHLDVEQALIRAYVEEIYTEQLEEHQVFPGAVGELNKTIYGLVQAGQC